VRAPARHPATHETLPVSDCDPHSGRSTPIAGQFDWGGTRSKRYQARPKAISSGSETRSRAQEQKMA
jgi:hypothetical protein